MRLKLGLYIGLPSWSLPVYQCKPQKMAAETWAQKKTEAGSANGKKLPPQRLWLVLCLAIISSTVSADAKGINYTISDNNFDGNQGPIAKNGLLGRNPKNYKFIKCLNFDH